MKNFTLNPWKNRFFLRKAAECALSIFCFLECCLGCIVLVLSVVSKDVWKIIFTVVFPQLVQVFAKF